MKLDELSEKYKKEIDEIQKWGIEESKRLRQKYPTPPNTLDGGGPAKEEEKITDEVLRRMDEVVKRAEAEMKMPGKPG